MKLNSKRNINIMKKALYVEQLSCYAKLCSLYKELSYFCGYHATSEDVQNRYSHILSIASSGNLDDFITSDFSEKEQKILKKYEKYSILFNRYNEAIKILSEVNINEWNR